MSQFEIVIGRRGFLTGLIGSALAAPVIVNSTSLMRISTPKIITVQGHEVFANTMIRRSREVGDLDCLYQGYLFVPGTHDMEMVGYERVSGPKPGIVHNLRGIRESWFYGDSNPKINWSTV